MSSLFGGASAAQPANTTTNSLFGRITPATTSATSSGGLFGAAPASTSSSTGGLFGTAPTTTTANTNGLFGAAPAATTASAGGLFGSAQPAQTSGSSLFGGLNAAARPATTGASLFGGASAAAPAATTGGGLFSNLNATTQPASTSLFGSTQPAGTSTSLFGSTAQPAANSMSAAPQEQPYTGANPSYFNQLLERGRKRQTEETLTPIGDLPQLELGLADISRKVRNLGQGGPSAGLSKNGDHTKAHYLLSASGVHTGKALRDLDLLASEGGPLYEYELGMTGAKRDLTRKFRDDFQDMLDGHIKQARDDFDKMVDEKLHGYDAVANRQRIYEHFGLKKPQIDLNGSTSQESGSFGRSRRSRLAATTNGKSFGISGMNKSVIGSTAPGRQSAFGDVSDRYTNGEPFRSAPEDRISRLRQDRYAEQVKELNIARMQEAPFSVLQKFSSVEAEQPSENTEMLLHAFSALVEITGEGLTAESVGSKERVFAKQYLDDSSQGGLDIRERIINGSRRFLEKLFLTQLESTVTKNPREANVGGIPTAVAKVKGYVRVRAARRELGPEIEVLQEVDGDYCWAVIFYLLRCGLTQEALEYVDANANAFRHIDRRFMSYLRHYVDSPERRLSNRDQTEIHNDYSQRTKLAPEDSIDPYRMMCYKIIGRCDLARRTIDTVSSDMMDFLWLQFSLAREYNRADEFAHEAFGLEEVRATIKDISERYFGANSDIPNAPTTLFFMQILGGMFEKAVADLFPHNYVAAVHAAIALAYYGLLRVSDISNSDDLLSYTTRQQSQLAFGSMIGLYTGDFRLAKPTAAVDYLALICLNADLPGDIGKRQRELCLQALTELVLETREYAQLLGDIRADGQRIKGDIEQRLKLIGLENEQDFLRHVTLVAARTAEDNGRTTDAALLFHLAEDYDKVISIVNTAVSLALTVELGEPAQKLMPLKPRSGENAEEVPRELQGSLSLTAVDDPIQLARNFRSLYSSSQMFDSKVRATNRDCCNLLLALADARRNLEAGHWAKTIDVSVSFAIV